ncbi:MAG TPA: ATPase domain-containing protein [Pyrinomonadaceae bacterium]|jgi:circadian clock protein KaiC|nr:ATPase domain-containing protein [Pyrinomonadaceae bacterium]
MDDTQQNAEVRASAASSEGRMGTGVEGFDDVLGGGFPAERLYLVEGDPGAGKTTLAMQFLMEGARRGEPVLYVTLSETEEEMRAVARSHGWSLEGVNIYELIPHEETLRPDSQYTIFHPAEIELGETIKAMLAEFERLGPRRVVIDSLSEMRLLAGEPLRYRRQVLALKRFFAGRGCTVLLLDDRTMVDADLQVHSIAHGVVVLEQSGQGYGSERRTLCVKKLRGARYRGGNHDFKIETGGIVVFPRLVAAEHRETTAREPVSSGVPELDALMGGGLDRGTSTLLMGPAGSGKSSVAAQFAAAAAERGESADVYIFDEGLTTYLARAEGLGIDLKRHVEAGLVNIKQVDPAELSPGEFAHIVRRGIDESRTRVVVIDSLNGYLMAMPEARYLIAQMHELLAYLNQRGVITLVITAQHGFLGTAMTSPVDVSYIADTVLLFRYFEAAGAVRNAVSVIKKRTGGHERTIRELQLSPRGISVGRALEEFHGVLTGVPVFRGGSESLLRKNDESRGAGGDDAEG